jgi:hypothetical protein
MSFFKSALMSLFASHRGAAEAAPLFKARPGVARRRSELRPLRPNYFSAFTRAESLDL